MTLAFINISMKALGSIEQFFKGSLSSCGLSELAYLLKSKSASPTNVYRSEVNT